jgi:hypothetical protein
MKMSASNVICFETFRSERNRQRSENVGEEAGATAATPFRERLASVLLSPRQIAHRRAMFDFGNQRRGRLFGSFTAEVSECE